jgi:glutathione synthase/RimK-type ligase-like ATP-grasp enzyme
MKLRFAAVDLIETNDASGYSLVEVNAIPGWKSAQSVLPVNVADQILSLLFQSIPSS